jgi:hypothetical protein
MSRYLLAAMVLLLVSPAAFAMRCGNRLVTVGQQDFQVRERCGDPFWSERYTVIEVTGARSPVETQREVQYDIWYYNPGRSDLMRRFVFRDGLLEREEMLGYGVDEIGSDCDPNRPYVGLTSGELIARCGEPASHRQNNATQINRLAPGYQRWNEQRREEWIYDFGDERFLRQLQLVDGRVVQINILRR